MKLQALYSSKDKSEKKIKVSSVGALWVKVYEYISLFSAIFSKLKQLLSHPVRFPSRRTKGTNSCLSELVPLYGSVIGSGM